MLFGVWKRSEEGELLLMMEEAQSSAETNLKAWLVIGGGGGAGGDVKHDDARLLTSFVSCIRLYILKIPLCLAVQHVKDAVSHLFGTSTSNTQLQYVYYKLPVVCPTSGCTSTSDTGIPLMLGDSFRGNCSGSRTSIGRRSVEPLF